MLLWTLTLAFLPVVASDTPTLTLTHPMPWQVIQRTSYVPATAHVNHPGGPTLGHALVAIRGKVPVPPPQTWEARTVLLKRAFGSAVDWKPLKVSETDGLFAGTVDLPAGGWYRLEVRALRDGKVAAAGMIEPFGVGEVFLIAGQSYAGNHNDERQRIADPEGRAVAFDGKQTRWGVAHDPQPGTTGDAGSIWPATVNHLLPVARVPIGLVNTSVGGTSTRQWLPGQPLFKNMVDVGKQVGRFRAVLWQQGESDVIEVTSAKVYEERLRTIADDAAKHWGFRPPWLLAKSTLHPTVYNKPVEEAVIREAVEKLSRQAGFRPGPDTDILGGVGVYRGAQGTQRHFTPEGQRMAGLLWFAAIWQELQQPSP